MGSNKGKDNLIVQAGLLATAGFISRIIGLLYVSPVAAIIGPVGLGYYQMAYNFYTIVLLISSYSIPSAISKVIAQKLSAKEYRNAHRMFLCSLGYVMIVGLAAGIFLYFGAGLFVEPSAIPVLRVFAPTIFLYGILGVLRGYFQAHKSMAQTSVSQILEQIINAAVSIGAAYGFIVLLTNKVGEVGVTEGNRGVYGAMGSALGTGAGVVAALLFMVWVYAINSKTIQRRIRRDRTEHVDSVGEIGLMIGKVILPFIFSTAIYNLSASLNTKIYTEIMLKHKGMDELVVTANYGVYNGQAVKISNIPIAFAAAMAAAIIPTVSQLVTKKDMEGAKAKVSQAMKTIMIISIPSMVGLFVLAKPITWMLFPREDTIELGARCLMALAVSVIFYGISTLSNSILQGIGKVNTPIYHAAVGLVLQTAVLVSLLYYTDMDVYALVIASLVYSGVICFLNQITIRRTLGYKIEWGGTFFRPLLAAIVMGGIAWGVYEGMLLLTDSIYISLLPAVVLAVTVYFAFVILFRGITEEELKGFPKGYVLVRIAKKCKLL